MNQFLILAIKIMIFSSAEHLRVDNKCETSALKHFQISVRL